MITPAWVRRRTRRGAPINRTGAKAAGELGLTSVLDGMVASGEKCLQRAQPVAIDDSAWRTWRPRAEGLT